MTVCYKCARARGGVYDQELKRWTECPQLPSIEARWDDQNWRINNLPFTLSSL